ncbi:beta strand repeat-containing protein [Spirosoma endophyticum]|uniref:Polymorphic outer membrane protein repeat-containing protein n=1 Tax=Spirosoma endophyticum TaxID=662367 RepID=A0A1I2HB64_9BACT|nr:choice-of-anchor Q domain-containing protein [Spirosoma endophyticum]SFF27475.1 polymorphic outer membrane protein repeat-containing protein [Spirosoma endophyticum]
MTFTLPFFTRLLGRVIPLLVLLVGASLLTQAQTIRYVKPAATGTGNGSSWANASGNLQAMINASVATDQVWVAGGTYKPTTGTDRNASFAMKIGVLIYGGFAGSETSLSQRPIINTTTPSSSILSGDLGTAGNIADNSYHVISNPMDLINTAVLDGFIITGGNANGGSSTGSGGGMYNPGNDSGLGASPTVRNCSFQGNSAGIGGAMTNYGSATSNPVLVNCLFRGNSAIQGGAIYNYKNSGAVGNPVLTNCSFQNNSASTSGGAIFNLGNFSNCAPVLTNCSFQNNSAPQGGAFYNDGNQFYSRPQLNNCVLFGNGGSNSIRNSQDSYVEAIYSLFEADAAFTNGFLGSNVSGVTVNPFASTSSVALNACAPAINSGNNDVYNQYNGTPTDLAGNPRFFPSGGQIDMGAVEFQAAPQSITITPPGANFATIGTTFNQTFSASGGSGPYILASGSLPPGITLATSGVLSGTPTQFGSYTFAVKVVDPVTGCSGLSAPYTLSVRSSKPIRYVKAGGTGNGDSWANASGDLQSQINVAGAEQVWVAAGTYKPGPAGNTDRIISFAMRGGVAIYGGFVGNEAALSNRPTINPVRGNPSTTILSGDIGVVGNNADNSYHVILNRDGLTSTAILDGFVITGGNANRDGYSYEGGGGMANICRPPAGAISPTVRNCSFQGNTATHGGAIFNDASGGQQECNPTLINCVFQDNSAGSGGAVSNNASNGTFCSPQFDNCYFINNTADNGGAMENFSGSRSQSNVRLTNCLFQSNSATSTGGAIYNAASGGSSSPVLINCSFQRNSIKAGAGSRLGGAIYFSTSGDITTAMLTNCSFQGNTASQGGAIYVESYQANSTSNINLISCVVFGNGGDGTFLGGRVAQDRYGLIYLSNTLIEASATRYQDRGGNILTNTSPFASPNSPELAANSPAVNAGSSDVQGTDVAGNPRIVGCRIDMGAYELQYDPAVAITAQPAASSVVCGRATVSVPVGVSGQYLTYQWYKDSFANPVTGQTSATLTLTNIQPANAGSYSLVVTGSCNSLTSTAFNLTVNQPTVSISPGSATICQGKSVLLTASGASTYTWSNNTTDNTLNATTAGTYSVTGVDGNGCTNTATATVTENKPTVSISPGSATICQGKSVLLTASGASTYTWSNNTTDNTLSATTAGTYSVTGVDGNGCTNTATATVTENKPTVSISPGSATICQAPSVLLTASGASTYTWSDNTTGNTLTANTPGTYSVTGVAANGCSNSATATVTDTRPSVSITASPSATVVQGASVTLTASGTGLTSFIWATGSTGNSTVINPATSAPYSVTVRNGAGCVTVASLDITVTPIGCSPVIYVTQTGSGQRDGSSWANALGSSQLQFGINAAADCGGNGQVWVATGTYKPTTGNDRNASFALRNGITIYGGFVGNETTLTDRPALNPVAARPSSTTLSGDIGTVGNTSDNSFRVISNPTSLSLTATAGLDGFVITGGAGGTLGGGLFNDGSSPTLRNCSFVNNSVSASGSTISRGGAIYNGNSSSPQLYNCYFLTNSASSLAGVNGFGGAMANLNSSNPRLTNCNFVNNQVSGSAQNQGGAIANNLNSSPQLINCSFLNNSASGSNVNRGGAVANGNGSNPQLINCSFLNNLVSGATSSTSNQGGAVYNGLSTPQLTNCVLFGNGGANTFYNANGGSVVAYSLLETTVTSFTAGAGNLTTDISPFVSAADARLAAGSPAINAGNSLSYTAAGGPATDLVGNVRIQSGTIDMGAYEFSLPPDLTPLLFVTPSLAYSTTTGSVVVDVFEINSAPTSGPITVYIAKSSLLSLSFDPGATSLGGRAVQNRLWSFDGTSNSDAYILTTTQAMGAGDKRSIGLSSTLTPGQTKGRVSVTATLVGGSGGEMTLTNNTDADQVEYFNK